MRAGGEAERSLASFIRWLWPYIDPADFQPNWHIDLICDYLEAVTAGEIRKLLITIPPRHMKSITVSVAWPAWTWIQESGTLAGPARQFLFASYANDLSVRDSVKCRRLIQSPPYQEAWGDRFQLTGDQNAKTLFANDKGGQRLPTSVDGRLTGEGGDIIVIDDPHNVREAGSEKIREATVDWWDDAMSTRLNDPKTGAYVIIQQRVHERDLAGHVLTEGDWEHLCLPARYEPDHPHVSPDDPRSRPGELLWPARFGDAELGDIETRLGSYGTAGQLQQRPAPRSGGYFQRAWFDVVDQAPAIARRVRYWDLAATEDQTKNDPDWTAGCRVALADGVYYVEDMRRLRGTPKDVETTVRQTASIDGRDVQIWMEQEPGASGKAMIDHYARRVLQSYAFRGNRETGSKALRADPASAAAEAGNIKLVAGAWNKAFLDELAAFPNAAHDDQVDALSGAFRMLARRPARTSEFLV